MKSQSHGFHLITNEVLRHLPLLPKMGLLNLFVQHTSCALSICELTEQREQSQARLSFAESRRKKAIANAAWAGQWDGDKIMISMGNHQTTVNLNANPDFTLAFATTDTIVAADYVGVVSGKKVKDKVAKTGWKAEKGEKVNAPVFTDFPMNMVCRIERKIDE